MKKIGSEVVKICTTHTASIHFIDCGMERARGYTLHITTPQAAIRVQRVNTRWQDRERNQLHTHRCTERRTEQVRQQRVQCDRLGYNIKTHHTVNIMDGRQRKVTGQIWFQNMVFQFFRFFRLWWCKKTLNMLFLTSNCLIILMSATPSFLLGNYALIARRLLVQGQKIPLL